MVFLMVFLFKFDIIAYLFKKLGKTMFLLISLIDGGIICLEKII